MNKKYLLGLILFACLITTGLFAGANYLINQGSTSLVEREKEADTKEGDTKKDSGAIAAGNEAGEVDRAASISSNEDSDEGTNINSLGATEEEQEDKSALDNVGSGTTSDTAVDLGTEEPWLSTNPTDTGSTLDKAKVTALAEGDEESSTENSTNSTISTSIDTVEGLQLIYDCNKVEYLSYIPEIVADDQLKTELEISNPDIDVDAEAAILYDAETKEILFYKNAVQAVFPASTAKLLTTLLALEWCKEEEEVSLGEEIKMIASDSSKANLKVGQILTIRNLLEGMLLPSGNDAAYAVAAYVGRKSLQNPEATKEEAIVEFISLMNQKAIQVGAKNSCFKTPDGYDAIGQYTTAYDMGLIGIAAADNETIIEISKKSSGRNIFPSGEDITWKSTNKLINKKYSNQYYSYAIGLKTGTSTMAGKCLVAAARKDGREVVCAVMNSTSSGRWEDAIALLKYGLEQ